jgi:hypothetical protein
MAGLRDYTLALLISGSLAAPLQADLKIRVQESFGRGGTTSLVYYCKEHFWRTESPGGREYMIVDWVSKRSISIDLALRQYLSTRRPGSRKPPIQLKRSRSTLKPAIRANSGRCSDTPPAGSSPRSAGISSTGIGRRQISRKSSPMGGISTFRVNFQH